MAIIELDDEDLREIRDRVIGILWVGDGTLTQGMALSVPDIAKIVRVDEDEAIQVINRSPSD